MDLTDDFKLDKEKLRVSVSTISSKASSYAKILATKENDFAKCRKNIVHSIRYLMFGMQIVEDGKISDYSCANVLAIQINSEKEESWENYEEKYIKGVAKQVYKKFHSLVPELQTRRKQKNKERRKKKAQQRKEEAKNK